MLWNLFPLNCCKENKSEHVRIMCDKVTAIAYINQKSWLESSNATILLEKFIWLAYWNLHVSAAYLPK